MPVLRSRGLSASSGGGGTGRILGLNEPLEEPLEAGSLEAGPAERTERHRRLATALHARFPVVALFRYLALSTETHAFCGALAFFALLAFYPASSLILGLSGRWLGPAAHETVLQALREYYPEGQAFLVRNLEVTAARTMRGLQVHSAAWILLGAAGFFVPLETAFNRLWAAREHRSYWRNQLVGFLLTSATCVLALAFVLFTAWLRSLGSGPAARGFATGALRLGAVGFAVAATFLFYRFLPNRRVRSRDVLPAALIAGVVAEAVRGLYMLALPYLALSRSQGPYYVSVSFALLAYVEAFVILGGAFLASTWEALRERRGYPAPEASG